MGDLSNTEDNYPSTGLGGPGDRPLPPEMMPPSGFPHHPLLNLQSLHSLFPSGGAAGLSAAMHHHNNHNNNNSNSNNNNDLAQATRRSLDLMRIRATDPRPCPQCGKNNLPKLKIFHFLLMARFLFFFEILQTNYKQSFSALKFCSKRSVKVSLKSLRLLKLCSQFRNKNQVHSLANPISAPLPKWQSLRLLESNCKLLSSLKRKVDLTKFSHSI